MCRCILSDATSLTLGQSKLNAFEELIVLVQCVRQGRMDEQCLG